MPISWILFVGNPLLFEKSKQRDGPQNIPCKFQAIHQEKLIGLFKDLPAGQQEP